MSELADDLQQVLLQLEACVVRAHRDAHGVLLLRRASVTRGPVRIKGASKAKTTRDKPLCPTPTFGRGCASAPVRRNRPWQTLSRNSPLSSAWTASAPPPRPAAATRPPRMSAADIMAVLFDSYLTLRLAEPARAEQRPPHLLQGPRRAAPLRLYKAAGAITDEELLTLAQVGSRLEGHPNPHVLTSWTSRRLARPGARHRRRHGAASRKSARRAPVPHLGAARRQRDRGRLGLGGVRQGVALRARQPHRHHRHEPARPERRDRAGLEHGRYAARVQAFGWHAIEIDGHDLAAIDRGVSPKRSRRKDQPDLHRREDEEGRGRLVPRGQGGLARQGARRGRGEAGHRGARRRARRPHPASEARAASRAQARAPRSRSSCRVYEVGREGGDAQGLRRRARGARRRATPTWSRSTREVSNSTYSEEFRKAHPDRFFEMYIAEQQLVVRRGGLRRARQEGRSPRRSPRSSRARTTRSAWRPSRSATIRLCGSPRGRQHRRGRPVADGARGPGDDARGLWQHRALPERPEPDRQARRRDGRAQGRRLPAHAPARSSRPLRRRTRGSPSAAARSCASRTRTWRPSSRAGITLHEALKAADLLKAEGIAIRVIDLYSVKPIDAATLHEAARGDAAGSSSSSRTTGPEGGLGDAVLEAFTGSAGQLPTVVAPRGAQDADAPRSPPSCSTSPASTPRTSSEPSRSYAKGRQGEWLLRSAVDCHPLSNLRKRRTVRRTLEVQLGPRRQVERPPRA